MNRWIGYLMLAIWASWAAALQALLVTRTPLGPWVPDLSVLLLVAAVGELHKKDALRIAVVIGLARVAYTIEPPFAVLAGVFGIALVVDGVRRFAEIGRPWVRVGLGAGASFLFGAWLVFVHAARLDAVGDAASKSALIGAVGLLPTLFTSAIAALVLWPVYERLPGLGALRRRRF